ncbi:SIS domain-containing protein [Actinomadura barringtoniae]|uniref:Glutamine--fructose-6-phosphate aminotransferase [isomerizing] n=1 Tax=Actinomadura barringtoniae TaxID=1427535 RepID=A0A939T4A2_9ACTN|nr:SIS domain-containing protein [Actinomadura barringtoniae]MBO2447924.1 SIS domain-containing protein [Actinomadura barringtoniae]
MEPIAPAVMIEQAERLGSDLRTHTVTFDQRVRATLTQLERHAVDRVYLTGDGDSYHAAYAAQLAFETIAGSPCEPVSAFRFETYTAPQLTPARAGRALLIAVSVSGGTQCVLASIDAAQRQGIPTVALTGTPGSAVTKAADHSIIVDLPDSRPSPGIRTYQASLLGLLLLADQLRHPGPGATADGLLSEIVGLAPAVEATANAAQDPCRRLAAKLASAPVIQVVGSGPSHGTAQFAAAKFIEGSGVYAAGQDLEEWAHVEQHAAPDDMPVIVIAPPGRSHARAVELAAHARRLGRYVIAVCAHDDTGLTRHAHEMLPVHGNAREELSPLLWHVFSEYLACYLAEALGRKPFQTRRG